MTDAAKGYLVRDAETTGGKGRKVDQIYPYTLRGLTEALAFNPSALQRHWDRLLPLLDRTLANGGLVDREAQASS
jgi:carboxymethylenebutenolidase